MSVSTVGADRAPGVELEEDTNRGDASHGQGQYGSQAISKDRGDWPCRRFGTRPTAGTLTLRTKAEIPYQPDALSVGGEPAGIGAALGAAKAGANTLLVEHYGFFGGVAASAGKSMGNCVATGHAAGLAAALSVQKRLMPRELKVGELQDALRADGVDLSRGGDDQDDLVNQG